MSGISAKSTAKVKCGVLYRIGGEPSVHLQRNDRVMVGWGAIQLSIPPEEWDSIGN